MVPGTELQFHTRNPPNMPEQNLNPEILAAALQGLEARRARLDTHIAEVRRMLGARPQQPAAQAEAPKRKRKLSAAGRRRIAAATRKRWAEYHRKKAETAKGPAKAVKKTARKVVVTGKKRAAVKAATQPV
jgi:hypothetical protein